MDKKIIIVLLLLLFFGIFVKAVGGGEQINNIKQIIYDSPSSVIYEENGHFRKVFYSGEVNYLKDGNYYPYNLSLSKSTLANFDYQLNENSGTEFKVFFKNNSNRAGSVRFEKNNYFFEYDLSGSQLRYYATSTQSAASDTLGSGYTSNSKDTNGIVDNNKIVYPDAYSFTNVSYELSKDMLKETFHVCKPSDYTWKDYTYLQFATNAKFNSSLKICANNQCYTPSGTQDDFTTTDQIDFKDENDTTIFFIPKPIVTLQNGTEIPATIRVKGSNAQVNYWVMVNISQLGSNSCFDLDPSLTMNFNATFQSVNSFAKDCTDGGNTIPPSNTLFNCTGTLTDISSQSSLDSSDNTRMLTTASGTQNPYQVFYFNLSVPKSDITSLNFSWEGQGFSELNPDGTIYGYWYNSTSSTWINMFSLPGWAAAGGNPSPYDSVKNNGTTNTQDFINSSNYFHALVYWDTPASNPGQVLKTDYVYLSVVYDDLIINSPTNNQEILNSLTTTLNVSSEGYNNTIWWTKDGGITNHTLCTNCNSPNSSTIDFVRQGFYNLTVYGNKSTGEVTSKTVTNLFVGNKTKYDYNNSNSNYATAYKSNTNTTSTFPPSGNLPVGFTYTNISNLTSLDFIDSSYSTMDHGVVADSLSVFSFNTQSVPGNIVFLDFFFSGNTNANAAYYDYYLAIWNISSSSWKNCLSGLMPNSASINVSCNTSEISNFLTNNQTSLMIYQTDGNTVTGAIDVVDYVSLNVSYSSQNVAPSLTNTLANNSNFSTSSVNFTFNISDDNDYLKNISLYLDGAINTTLTNYPITANVNNSLNFSINGIADGVHSWFIQAYDSDNSLTNSSNFTFTVDSNNPNATLLLPTNATYNSTTSQNFTVNATDNLGLRNISLYLNGVINSTVTFIAGTTQSVVGVVVSLVDGIYNWFYQVFDNMGNTYPTDNRTITIDSTYPAIQIITANGTNTTDTQLDINYTLSDTNIQSCKYTRNAGATNTTLTCGTNLTAITWDEGINTVTIYAKDLANNENSSSITFRLDTTAPTLTIIHPRIGADSFSTGTIALNYSVSDSGVGLSTCWYMNNTGSNITIACGTNTTISQPSDGTYTVYMWANDTLGNLASASKTWSVSSTAPLVNLQSPSEGYWFNYTNNIYFNFTASDGNGIDTCQLWGNWTGTWALNESKTFSGDTSVDVLEGFFVKNITDTGSIWNVWCNDTTGLGGTSTFAASNATFGVDTISPLVSTLYPTAINYTVIPEVFNYSRSDTNIDSCWYSINDGVSNSSAGACNNFSITANQGTNNWTVYIKDKANHINSSRVSFFVDSIYPTIDFTTGTLSDGVYVNQNYIYMNTTWAETNFYDITFFADTSAGYSFPQYDYNFTSYADGVYNYFVTICDVLNQCNTTATRTITLDTTKPLVNILYPTNSNYTSIPTQLNFSYSDTNAYQCWRSIDNGVTNSSHTSCSNYSITATQGTNNWTVYMNDLAGNENSSMVSFFVDSILPTININSSFSSGSYINYNTSIQLNLTIADTNLNTCWYNNNATNTTFNCLTENNLSLNLSDGQYNITIFANDTLGNLATNRTNFTVDTTYPVLYNLTSVITTGDSAFDFYYNLTEVNPASCSYALTRGTYTFLNETITCGARIDDKVIPTFGLDYNLTVYALDLAGNENSTSLIVNVPATVTGSGGGGGGGGFSIVNLTNLTQGFCGNRICETSYNETYLSCAADCQGNLNPITDCFAKPTDREDTCFIGKTPGLLAIGIFMAVILLVTTIFKKKKNSDIVVNPLAYIKKKSWRRKW